MQIAGGQRQCAGAGAGAAPRPTLAPVFSPGPETGPTRCPCRTDGRTDRQAAAGPRCLPSPTGCSWRGASPGARQHGLLRPAALIPARPPCDPSWDWHGLISQAAVPNYLLLRPKVPSLNPNQGHSSPRMQQLIPPAAGKEQQHGGAGCRVTSVHTSPGAAGQRGGTRGAAALSPGWVVSRRARAAPMAAPSSGQKGIGRAS